MDKWGHAGDRRAVPLPRVAPHHPPAPAETHTEGCHATTTTRGDVTHGGCDSWGCDSHHRKGARRWDSTPSAGRREGVRAPMRPLCALHFPPLVCVPSPASCVRSIPRLLCALLFPPLVCAPFPATPRHTFTRAHTHLGVHSLPSGITTCTARPGPVRPGPTSGWTSCGPRLTLSRPRALLTPRMARPDVRVDKPGQRNGGRDCHQCAEPASGCAEPVRSGPGRAGPGRAGTLATGRTQRDVLEMKTSSHRSTSCTRTRARTRTHDRTHAWHARTHAHAHAHARALCVCVRPTHTQGRSRPRPLPGPAPHEGA